MASADCVDVEMFHKHDVECHLFAADIMCGIGTVFVTVGTLNGDGYTVDAELLSGHEGVAHTVFYLFDSHIAEANLATKCFCYSSATISQSEDKGVEVGRFGCPRVDVAHAADRVTKGRVPIVGIEVFLLLETACRLLVGCDDGLAVS